MSLNPTKAFLHPSPWARCGSKWLGCVWSVPREPERGSMESHVCLNSAFLVDSKTRQTATAKYRERRLGGSVHSGRRVGFLVCLLYNQWLTDSGGYLKMVLLSFFKGMKGFSPNDNSEFACLEIRYLRPLPLNRRSKVTLFKCYMLHAKGKDLNLMQYFTGWVLLYIYPTPYLSINSQNWAIYECIIND